jgi:hypothetical protein
MPKPTTTAKQALCDQTGPEEDQRQWSGGQVIKFPYTETPDEKLLVSDPEGGIFCPGQEIKGLRGGVHRYAAQFTC